MTIIANISIWEKSSNVSLNGLIYNAHEMLFDDQNLYKTIYVPCLPRKHVIYDIYNIFNQIKTVYERNII